MIDGATVTTQDLRGLPFTSRRILVLFGVLAVLWSTLSWFAAHWRFQERSADLIARETSEARQRLPLISANMERVLSRLQGLAGVVASGNEVKAALAAFGAGVKASTLSQPTTRVSSSLLRTAASRCAPCRALPSTRCRPSSGCRATSAPRSIRSHGMATAGRGGTVRVTGSPYPHIAVRSELP